jgi:hypothetical protein
LTAVAQETATRTTRDLGRPSSHGQHPVWKAKHYLQHVGTTEVPHHQARMNGSVPMLQLPNTPPSSVGWGR